MQTRRAIVTVILLVASLLVWQAAERRRGNGRTLAASDPSLTATMTAGARDANAGPALPDARSKVPAEIRGTVRERGGGPLAGAQVCTSWWADGVGSDDRREPVCAISDAAGAYRLTALVPGGHDVSASAPGHVPQGWRARPGEYDGIRLTAGQVRAGIDFALATGGVLVRGVVSDVNGGPIADARVTVQDGPWGSSASTTVRADGQGTFTLWAAPGAVRVSGEAEGYADGETQAVAPAQAVELLLTPESSLAGIVVEAGTRKPVPDVLVGVGGGDGESRFSYGGGATARTDAQGRFRLERLKPGRYKPTATGRGVFGEPADSVLLGLGQRVDDVTIEVHPARVVGGRVEIDSAGKRTPCPHGSVRLRGSDNSRNEWDTTDDDGQIELRAVRAGRYQVMVSCDGYLEHDRYDAITVADQDVTGLVWTVTAGGSVRGVVRTAAGEPVAGVEMSAQTSGAAARAQRSWGSDTSRDDGSYLLTGLVAGDYTLRVWSDEHRAPEPPPRVTVVVGKETPADLTLADDGSIDGIVVDTERKPVSGADIRITGGRGFMGGASARSGEDGHFLLRGVEPGDRRVIAVRGWSDELRKPGTTDDDVQGEQVKVLAGKTATVRLIVESRAGVIKGVVKDDQGEPVVDAWVVASRESDAAGALAGGANRDSRWSWGRNDRPVVTDQGGAFTIRELSPGPYTVRGFRRGGGEAVAEHVAVGGAVTLVIRATGLVAGTVTTKAGVAVDEFEVGVSDVKVGFARSESFYMTGGRFTVRDLPAGVFTVTVTAAGGRAIQDITLKAGEHHTGMAFVLEDNLTVRGRIVDVVSGAPVAGLSCRITPRKGSTNNFVITMGGDGEKQHISGDDGRFEIERAAPGKGYLIGFPLDFAESTWGFVRHPVDVVAGAGVIDLGDVPAVKRRVKFGDPTGDLGLSFVEIAPDTEPEAYQLKVSKVRAGSPGEVAGVKAGDVIVTIDGLDIRGARSMLGWNLISVPVGARVALGLARGATVTVTAGAPP